MKRASGPEHYSSPSNDNGAPPLAWWRLGVSQWVALIALTTLLGATTVHALTPRELQVPPDFDAQMEKLALAIILMPCEHREPGYPDTRVADLRVSPDATD